MKLRKYLPLLRALISIAALVLLLTLYDFKETFNLVAAMHGAAFIAAVAAFAATTILFVLKWNLTLPANVGVMGTARGYVASYFYSLLPTGQMGAELGKVMTLANHADFTVLTGSVVFDKVAGLLTLAILGALAWFLAHGAALWMIVVLSLVAAGCIVALVCTPFAATILLASMLPAVARRLLAKLVLLSQPIARWVKDPILLIKVLVLGLAGQACMIAVYVIIARALSIDVPLPYFALLVVIANLATLVPISLGGVGVREASLVGLLTAQGVRAESAIALSLTVFAVFLIGAFAGAAVEFHQLMNAWRRLAARSKTNAVDAPSKKKF